MREHAPDQTEGISEATLFQRALERHLASPAQSESALTWGWVTRSSQAGRSAGSSATTVKPRSASLGRAGCQPDEWQRGQVDPFQLQWAL
jgi:hypothetical protein